MSMRALMAAMLPLSTATVVAMGIGEAKAITIRYSLENPVAISGSLVTGGTINLASLDQQLGDTSIVFTVDAGAASDTFTAPYNGGSIVDLIDYFSGENQPRWRAGDFSFGSITSSRDS